MFTKNYEWKNLLDYTLGFRSSAPLATPNYAFTGTVNKVVGGVQTINLMNALRTFMTKAVTQYNRYDNGTSGFTGVAFGDGTTEPTEDDTWLSGNQHTSITSSNTTVEVTESEEGDERCVTAVYTINNNTGADITIGEVGLFSYCTILGPSGSYNAYISVLIERSLLENPITIPAGGVGKVTYTISRTWGA